MDSYTGDIDATAYGPSCPQQAIKLPVLDGLPAETVDAIVNSIYNVVLPSDEDCEHIHARLLLGTTSNSFLGLTINVIKPSSANDTSNLPVVAVGHNVDLVLDFAMAEQRF